MFLNLSIIATLSVGGIFACATPNTLAAEIRLVSEQAHSAGDEPMARGNSEQGEPKQPAPSAETIARVRAAAGRVPATDRRAKLALGVLEDYQTIYDDDLEALRELPDITDVYLSGYFTENGIRHLKGLHQIEVLLLDPAVEIDSTIVAHIATLSNLRELHVRRYLPDAKKTDFNDASLEVLSKLRHLEVLELRGIHLSDKGLRHLASFPRLRKVRIWSPEFTDDALSAMPKLKNISNIKYDRERHVISGEADPEPAADVKADAAVKSDASKDREILDALRSIDARLEQFDKRIQRLEEK